MGPLSVRIIVLRRKQNYGHQRNCFISVLFQFYFSWCVDSL